MTAMAAADIVIIEDHPEYLDYLATLLRRAGYVVAGFGRAEPALSFLNQCRPSLLITDVFMPEKDGFEVLREVRRSFPDLPLIAVSGLWPGSQSLFLDAMKAYGRHGRLREADRRRRAPGHRRGAVGRRVRAGLTMPPIGLRRKAAVCRRLAAFAREPKVALELRRLAAEFERAADSAERDSS